MSIGEPIITYLSKFTQVRDELGGVGMTVPKHGLVNFALLGLYKSWYGFQDVVCQRENFPSGERLWTDCIQEEIWRGSRDGRSMKTKDKESFTLAGKSSKAKGKEGQGVAQSSRKGKKKDLSKIKFFHCHEFGQYSPKCLERKEESSKDHVAASTEVYAFSAQFKKDFLLIACMESSTYNSVWYIDSRASFHMTRNKKSFSHLKEKDMQFRIDLGDDGMYATRGIGTINFQRESSNPLHLRDVLYVP